MIPGMYPARARSRKQIRQRPNFLSTLRGRPHVRQRRTFRVENFGFRSDLMIMARLAICRLSYFAKGMPNSRRRACAVSSRPAVVTMVTFKPFDLSTFE